MVTEEDEEIDEQLVKSLAKQIDGIEIERVKREIDDSENVNLAFLIPLFKEIGELNDDSDKKKKVLDLFAEVIISKLLVTEEGEKIDEQLVKSLAKQIGGIERVERKIYDSENVNLVFLIQLFTEIGELGDSDPKESVLDSFAEVIISKLSVKKGDYYTSKNQKKLFEKLAAHIAVLDKMSEEVYKSEMISSDFLQSLLFAIAKFDYVSTSSSKYFSEKESMIKKLTLIVIKKLEQEDFGKMLNYLNDFEDNRYLIFDTWIQSDPNSGLKILTEYKKQWILEKNLAIQEIIKSTAIIIMICLKKHNQQELDQLWKENKNEMLVSIISSLIRDPTQLSKKVNLKNEFKEFLEYMIEKKCFKENYQKTTQNFRWRDWTNKKNEFGVSIVVPKNWTGD